MTLKRFAIVGFGCAGVSAARAIREQDVRACIDVYSAGMNPPYNPMLTTYYAKGAIAHESLFPFGNMAELADALQLNVHVESPMKGLDAANRVVMLQHGSAGPYDAILLSTGASAIVPPIPGAGLPNVFSMRTVQDAEKMHDICVCGKRRRILVVGASMVGIKVAEAAMHHGVACTMVDAAEWIFPLAAFRETAERLMRMLEEKGLAQRYGVMLTSIRNAEDGCLIAEFKDHSTIEADAIALCIGTRPNTGMLRSSGVALDRGILVDACMRTSVEGIYAAGDCCQAIELQSGTPQLIGLWANAGLQGRTAGRNMSSKAETSYSNSVFQNITHFFDTDFVSMGNVRSCAPNDPVWTHEEGGIYIRAVRDDRSIKCINTIGMPLCGGVLKHLQIKSLTDGSRSVDLMLAGRLKALGFPMDFFTWLEA